MNLIFAAQQQRSLAYLYLPGAFTGRLFACSAPTAALGPCLPFFLSIRLLNLSSGSPGARARARALFRRLPPLPARGPIKQAQAHEASLGLSSPGGLISRFSGGERERCIIYIYIRWNGFTSGYRLISCIFFSAYITPVRRRPFFHAPRLSRVFAIINN